MKKSSANGYNFPGDTKKRTLGRVDDCFDALENTLRKNVFENTFWIKFPFGGNQKVDKHQSSQWTRHPFPVSPLTPFMLAVNRNVPVIALIPWSKNNFYFRIFFTNNFSFVFLFFLLLLMCVLFFSFTWHCHADILGSDISAVRTGRFSHPRLLPWRQSNETSSGEGIGRGR